MVLFWLACIPVRLGLAWAVYARAGGLSGAARVAVAAPLAAVSAAFAVLHAFRMRMSAPESSTGGTWWDSTRPLHAGAYLAAASWVASGDARCAGLALAADAAVGAASWVARRSSG